MMQNKFSDILKFTFVILTAFALFITGVLFFWFEYRPGAIRKTCTKFAETESEKDVFVYEIIYRHCLRKHGIEYCASDGIKEE